MNDIINNIDQLRHQKIKQVERLLDIMGDIKFCSGIMDMELLDSHIGILTNFIDITGTQINVIEHIIKESKNKIN